MNRHILEWSKVEFLAELGFGLRRRFAVASKIRQATDQMGADIQILQARGWKRHFRALNAFRLI